MCTEACGTIERHVRPKLTCRDLKGLLYSVHAQTLRTHSPTPGPKAKPGTETLSCFYCGQVSVCRFRISLRWEKEQRTITNCKHDIKSDSDTGRGWEGEDDLRRSSTVKCERKDTLQRKKKKKGKKGAITSQQQGRLSLGATEGIEVTSHCRWTVPEEDVLRCRATHSWQCWYLLVLVYHKKSLQIKMKWESRIIKKHFGHATEDVQQREGLQVNSCRGS